MWKKKLCVKTIGDYVSYGEGDLGIQSRKHTDFRLPLRIMSPGSALLLEKLEAWEGLIISCIHVSQSASAPA